MSKVEITVSAAIAKVSIKVKQKDDLIRRICTVVLEREFDILIAKTLGTDAVQARESLMAHGISKVEIPIDTMVARARLVSGKAEVELPMLRGIKAVGKVKTTDDGADEPPTIGLSYEFDFHEKAWVFLGRNCAAYIDAYLTPLQTEMNLAPPPKAAVGADDDYVPGPGEAF